MKHSPKDLLELAEQLEAESSLQACTARNLRRIAETRQTNRLTPEGRERIADAARHKAEQTPTPKDPKTGKFTALRGGKGWTQEKRQEASRRARAYWRERKAA